MIIYRNRITIISWTAVILWLTLIFNLSSQVAEQSNQLSTGITEIIVKTVDSTWIYLFYRKLD